VVIEDIENLKNTGRVRMGKEEWRAESESGESIPEGQSVAVTKIEGTHLIVKMLTEE
jgi:membrane protein implicated in regulation of membrane protease activity